MPVNLAALLQRSAIGLPFQNQKFAYGYVHEQRLRRTYNEDDISEFHEFSTDLWVSNEAEMPLYKDSNSSK